MIEIKNTKVYGLEDALVRSGYPMITGDAPDLSIEYYEENDFKRGTNLCKHEKSSGHLNYLTGISVHFDIKAPLYMWKQIERYHFFQIISSQSTMHRIGKMKLRNILVKDVDERVIPICEELQEEFIKTNSIESFRKLIATIPSGIEYWAGINTNYLQLLTIYEQRKNHKLEEWKLFCNWIEELPYFKELCLK